MFVETHALTKSYKTVTALSDCSLTVARGEVFGLLGPNGAGKTTLLRLILGYIQPTSGSASVDGIDCTSHSVEVRQRVAYLPGDARLPRQMRGRDVLKFFAEIRPETDLDRCRQLADRLELDLSRRVAFMSTGMRQKLALAVTLAAETPLLILDEPTANLDPTVRGAVIEMVAEARDDGRTVIFSSHVLSEVDEVCDRVVILKAGRLVHTQVMSELRRQHRIEADLNGPMPELPAEFGEQLTVSHEEPNRVVIETAGELPPLLHWLADLPLEDVRIEVLGLRSVYNRIHTARSGSGDSCPVGSV